MSAPGASDFDRLYDRLAKRDPLIYPRKLTQTPTFRIGCIGALGERDFAKLTEAFIADAAGDL